MQSMEFAYSNIDYASLKAVLTASLRRICGRCSPLLPLGKRNSERLTPGDSRSLGAILTGSSSEPGS
jgi:hypothetical protein